MKTYMFPGQGSQARGMGGTLFDEFPELTEKADKILGYSIKELCLQDPRRELNKTQFTQPALYVVNALSYYKKLQETGDKPDFVAGHSLGEFNALLAAEALDFEAGLKLVKKRGELMSQTTEGAMAAILNATRDQVEELLVKNKLSNVDIANYNTPLQIVISGPMDEITACQDVFQFDNVMYVPLNTSGAFHSRLMQPAREKFEAYLKKFKFGELKIPVISNVTARPYEGDAVFDNLSQQISSTVLWCDAIQYLMAQAEDMSFVEVGQGDVLTKMMAKIQDQLAKLAAAKAAKSEIKLAVDNGKAADPVAEVTDAANNDAAPAVNPFASAEEKVSTWNKRHPVGTKITSLVMDYGNLATRTPAMVLFGHRAAIYVEGYNGYFDLDEVAVV